MTSRRPSEFLQSGGPNWRGSPRISVTRQLRRRRSKVDFALLSTRLQEAAERPPSRMLRSDFADELTQFPDFAEFLAESETGEAPVHVFNPVTRKIFTRPEVHRQANDRSVHDQVSRSGLGQALQTPSDRNLISRAKLRRILRRIACRKGSKSSFLLLRTPLKSLAFRALRFLS